jgi:hypothetical protein
MAKTVISFTVDSESDRDLVRWLDSQDNRSAAIRKALRDHIGKRGVTLEDIYEVVKGLEHKLQIGVIVTGASSTQSDDWSEPPEAAAALNALGL